MKQDPTDPTGVHDDSERGNKGVTRARNRKANAALKLHIDGEHPDDIAEVLGYPDGGAVRVAIELALERELHEESREEMRRMVGYRLQRLTRAVWNKAVNEESPEQLAAQREARANLAEFSRLYGLGAPQEHVVHTPTDTLLGAQIGDVGTADWGVNRTRGGSRGTGGSRRWGRSVGNGLTWWRRGSATRRRSGSTR